MTQVDFYVLDAAGGESREHFACRLTDKAFAKGNRVYLHVADEMETARLDDLLWTFRDGSFLPHAKVGSPQAKDAAVLVGFSGPPEDQSTDVLINLAGTVPEFFTKFTRVAELAGPSEADKRAARERFRAYREQGCEPTTHELG